MQILPVLIVPNILKNTFTQVMAIYFYVFYLPFHTISWLIDWYLFQTAKFQSIQFKILLSRPNVPQIYWNIYSNFSVFLPYSQCWFIKTWLYKQPSSNCGQQTKVWAIFKPKYKLKMTNHIRLCSSCQSIPSTLEIYVKTKIYKVTYLRTDLKVRPFELKL